MAELSEDQRHYAENMAKHKEAAEERAYHSIQRFDVLSVSVSGAGLYVSLEAMKFILTEEMDVSTCLAKFSAAFFSLAIVANFISQITAHLANSHEVDWAHAEYEDARNGVPGDEKAKDAILKRADAQIRLTHMANAATAFFMGIGIFVLGYFCATAF